MTKAEKARELALFKAAQKTVDAVLGKGEYQRINGFSPARGETSVQHKLMLMRARKAAGKARWDGVGPRARSRQMKAVRASGGGRQRSKERCWCGKYTIHSAKQRGFDCCKRAGKYRGEKQP